MYRLMNPEKNPLSWNKLKLIVAIAGFSIVFFAGISAHGFNKSKQAAHQERTHVLKEATFPKDIIKVMDIKNLSSENFPNDFEMIIKNTSDKKIYGVNLLMRFPLAQRGGAKIGAYLVYGNDRLFRLKEKAGENDVSLNPGATTTLKLSPDRARVLRLLMKQPELPLSSFAQVEFFCQTINLGNGTGYRNDRFVDSSSELSLNRKRTGTNNYATTGKFMSRLTLSNVKAQQHIGCNYWSDC